MRLSREVPTSREYEPVRQYLEEDFFPRLRERSVGAWVQVIPPRVSREMPTEFAMRHVLERNVFLELVLREGSPRSTVTLTLVWRWSGFLISGIVASVLTCGLGAAVFVPVLLIKRGRCLRNFDSALDLLREGLEEKSDAAETGATNQVPDQIPPM